MWHGYLYIYIYIYIYWTLLIAFSLLHSDSQLDSFQSHALAQPQISRQIQIETTANKEEHIADKNTFNVMTKLVYLPHSHILNFAWNSKSPHTSYRYTLFASGQTNTSLLCSFYFFNTRAHGYVRTKTLIHIHSICISHPPTHTHTHTHTHTNI